MFRRLLGAMAMVGAWALPAVTLPAHAEPSPLAVVLQTDTTAVAESAADIHSDTSPASASPLITSSVVVGVTDFASGGAIAADGLLSTSAEVSSVTGFASGVGSSRYLASFAGASIATVHLDFATSVFADLPASSFATAVLLILNDGVTVLEEVISLSGPYDFTVGFATGAQQSIDLLLTSEAYTLGGGSAANFASVAIAVSLVPEPGSLTLAVLALVTIGARRRGMRFLPTAAVPA